MKAGWAAIWICCSCILACEAFRKTHSAAETRLQKQRSRALDADVTRPEPADHRQSDGVDGGEIMGLRDERHVPEDVQGKVELQYGVHAWHSYVGRKWSLVDLNGKLSGGNRQLAPSQSRAVFLGGALLGILLLGFIFLGFRLRTPVEKEAVEEAATLPSGAQSSHDRVVSQDADAITEGLVPGTELEAEAANHVNSDEVDKSLSEDVSKVSSDLVCRHSLTSGSEATTHGVMHHSLTSGSEWQMNAVATSATMKSGFGFDGTHGGGHVRRSITSVDAPLTPDSTEAGPAMQRYKTLQVPGANAHNALGANRKALQHAYSSDGIGHQYAGRSRKQVHWDRVEEENGDEET